MAQQPSRHDEPADFEEGQYKVCDLCGALNHVERFDCFVCGWHGHFTTTPESIHHAFLRQRGIDVAPPQQSVQTIALPPPATAVATHRPGVLTRLMAFLRGLFGKRREADR